MRLSSFNFSNSGTAWPDSHFETAWRDTPNFLPIPLERIHAFFSMLQFAPPIPKISSPFFSFLLYQIPSLLTTNQRFLFVNPWLRTIVSSFFLPRPLQKEHTTMTERKLH